MALVLILNFILQTDIQFSIVPWYLFEEKTFPFLFRSLTQIRLNNFTWLISHNVSLRLLFFYLITFCPRSKDISGVLKLEKKTTVLLYMPPNGSHLELWPGWAQVSGQTPWLTLTSVGCLTLITPIATAGAEAGTLRAGAGFRGRVESKTQK